MGKRVAVLSALLALLATFLLAQPAGAQEDDPCANPPPGGDPRDGRERRAPGHAGADVIVAGTATTSSWVGAATT
jgi:hypothetical protein